MREREKEGERNAAQLRASWKTLYRNFIESTGTLAKGGLQTEFASSIEQKQPVVRILASFATSPLSTGG